MRKGKQTSLSQALGTLSKRLDSKSGGLLQLRVKEAWVEIAGPTVLSHTTGAHLRGHELVVFVDTGLWATELSALSEQYRQALEKALGNGSVKTVRFTVSRKVAEQFRIEVDDQQAGESRKEDVVPSVPLSEGELRQVLASVEAIPDEELRQAVLKATVADLEWKKGIEAASEAQARREGL
jgi:hypothetical protein